MLCVRKLFAPLLCLCLLCPALALGQTLYAGGAGDEASALSRLTEYLAGSCGWEMELDDSEEEAAGGMLANGGLCLATQQLCIRALQGYCDGDPRTDMRGVTAVACQDLFLLMNADEAEALGIADLSGFRAYAEANEYSLILMRSLDAGACDRACCVLADALCLDSEVFMDLEDMEACADEETPYVLVVTASDAVRLSGSGFAVLGCLSGDSPDDFPEAQSAAEAGLPMCQAVWYGILSPANGTGDDAAVTASLTAAMNADAWDALLSELHLREVEITGFAAFVTEQCADLVDYMTAEGLFFYEE